MVVTVGLVFFSSGISMLWNYSICLWAFIEENINVYPLYKHSNVLTSINMDIACFKLSFKVCMKNIIKVMNGNFLFNVMGG